MTKKPKLVDSTFVDGASLVKKAVGQIRIGGDRIMGTGFRISEDLIMTCQHVGKSISQDDIIHFHYGEPAIPGTPASGVTQATTETFQLRPDIFYYEGERLDFAVVAVSEICENLNSSENIEIISSVRLIKDKKQLENLALSIISYPEGKPLKLSLLQKAVVEDPSKKLVVGNEGCPVTEEIILHAADTEVGSSGAPIFDERWRLIGIHQGLAMSLQSEDNQPKEVFYANYGTFMKYVLDEMFSKPDEGLTDFEKKFKASGKDLGIPFKHYSNKLTDSTGSGKIPMLKLWCCCFSKNQAKFSRQGSDYNIVNFELLVQCSHSSWLGRV